MGFFPEASNHNIPPGPNDPRIKPRIIVLHIMVGSIASAESRFRDGEGVEAHMGFPYVGRPWQWRDFDFQADAQFAGNDYCISFETEGIPGEKLNANQLYWIDRVSRFLMAEYDIPARIVASTGDRGFGYHAQFDSWNPSHKTCPTELRIQQLETIIMPKLALPEGKLSMDEATVIVRQIATGDENVGADRARNNLKHIREEIEALGTEITGALQSIDARLTALEAR